MKDNGWDPEDKPEACDFCQFKTQELRPYANAPFREAAESHKWLCRLCANTPAGNAHEYPDQFKGEINAMKCTCFVGNTILAEMRKPKVSARIQTPSP